MLRVFNEICREFEIETLIKNNHTYGLRIFFNYSFCNLRGQYTVLHFHV